MFKRLKGLFCIILSLIIIIQSNLKVSAFYLTDSSDEFNQYDYELYGDSFYNGLGEYKGNIVEFKPGDKIVWNNTSGGVFRVFINGQEEEYPDNTLYDFYPWFKPGYTNRFKFRDLPAGSENKSMIGHLVPTAEMEDGNDWYTLGYFNLYVKLVDSILNYKKDIIFDSGYGEGEPVVYSDLDINQSCDLYDGNGFYRNGHKLVGWQNYLSDVDDYIDPDYELGQTNVNITPNTGNIAVLYANWKNYKVEYDPNGGVNNGYDYSTRMDNNNNIVLEDPTGTFINPNGLVFKGWKKDISSNTADFQPNEIITPDDFPSNTWKMTLYAHWGRNVDNYTLKYDSNDNSNKVLTEILEVGSSIILKDGSSFNREDYELIGWSTSKDGSTTIYKPGEQVSALSNTKDDVVTLYAQWKKKSYTIKYNNNITNNQLEDTVEAIYDKDHQLAHGDRFTNNGYTFKEWNTSPDGTGTSYLGGFTVTNLANIGDTVTLYAIWVKDTNNYTIKYNVNDGSSNTFEQTSEVGKDVTINDGSTLHRDGYKFIGWNTKQDGTGKSYEPGKQTESLTQTKDDVVNLYAQWEKIIENYTIKYNSNDETNSYSIQVAVLGNDVILSNGSNLSREGYTLKGWSKSKDGSTTVYDLGSTVKSLASNKDEVINLYAVWEKNKTIEDSNNGTSSGNGTNTTPPTTDKPTTGGSSSGGSSSGSSSEDSTTDDSKDESVENEKDPIIKEDVDFSGNDLVFKPDIDFSQDYEVKLEDELLEKDKDYKEDNNSIIINKDVIVNKDTGDYKIEFIQNGSSIIHTIKVKVPSLKIRKLMGRNNKFNLKMLNTNNMKSITWTSKNPKVATVTKKGIIKTKSKIGIATIEADIITKDGYRFKYIIKVDVREKIKNTYNHSNYNIYDKVNPTVMLDKELHIGKPVKINFNNLYSKAKIKYYTSNKKVAKVNKNGYLVGKKKGKCNIKVVIKQNNYKYIYYINAIVTK